MAPRLLIATGNPGKMREYAGLLRDIPFELVSLGDLGITYEVEETGETFEENAWLKASEYAAISGLLTLAEERGYPRPTSETPTEYQKTLEMVFPAELVRSVTAAFVRACYGHHPAPRQQIEEMRVSVERLASQSG